MTAKTQSLKQVKARNRNWMKRAVKCWIALITKFEKIDKNFNILYSDERRKLVQLKVVLISLLACWKSRKVEFKN